MISLAKYQPIATFGVHAWLEQIKKRVDIEAAIARIDNNFLGLAIPRLTADPLGPYIVESEFFRSLDGDLVSANVRELDFPDLDRINVTSMARSLN